MPDRGCIAAWMGRACRSPAAPGITTGRRSRADRGQCAALPCARTEGLRHTPGEARDRQAAAEQAPPRRLDLQREQASDPPWSSLAGTDRSIRALTEIKTAQHRPFLRSPHRGTSIVHRALADSGADRTAVAGRELLLAVRHAGFRRATPVEQPYQIAAVGIARLNHRAELGAFHDAVVGREIEAALFEAPLCRARDSRCSAP